MGPAGAYRRAAVEDLDERSWTVRAAFSTANRNYDVVRTMCRRARRTRRGGMRIAEVGWENYRRLPDATLRVRDHLILVGPNDSGKSSVLRAIHLCLGMPGPQLAASIDTRDLTDLDKALVLRVVLDGIVDDDRAAFPDEISTVNGETLTVEVVATLEGADAEQTQVRRRFPQCGHGRAPTRLQMQRFQWAYVPATRSLYRELGPAASGVVRTLLSTIDLEDERAAFDAAADSFRGALARSEALAMFRRDLAEALTGALPRQVTPEDLQFVSDADLLEDPLANVSVTVSDGDTRAPLAQQSDGIRALSVLTLLGMSHKGAQIVGIDEPEIHLHHSAQRSIAARLRAGPGQRVLVTHSPSIIREMNPLDIVTMGADRIARQLPPAANIAELDATTRHWSPHLIEPLTARAVLLVEGASDRILCDRVAQLVGIDLNRRGVSIFEMDGGGLFERAYELFGPPGFELPIFGLLDEDARSIWAEVLGIEPENLGQGDNYAVCNPDLEGAYVERLGVTRILELLFASPNFTENGVRNSCGVDLRDIRPAILTEYCGHKKRKVHAALAVATGMTQQEAEVLTPMVTIVRAASA
jgi:putative ATP-dependent endonuclease of OLD family